MLVLRRRWLPVALLSAGLCVGSACSGGAADDDTAAPRDDDGATVDPICEAWGDPVAWSSIQDEGLSEISGIVASDADPDLFWVHQDSGATPVITAIGLDGRTRGTVTLDGVANIDWEDLASGPCGDQTCLFVGEFGDNSEVRTDVAILRLPEPVVSQDGFDLHVSPDVFPYSYESGPIDAEALLVDPDGLPVIVDKVSGGQATLHRLPSLEPGVPVVAEELAAVTTGNEGAGFTSQVTGADLLRDGSKLLVRTYGQLFEYLLTEEGLAGAATAVRQGIPHGVELQGEAAAWAPDGLGVWHIAEGVGATLYFVPCEVAIEAR
jgi:hypothetical protein